MQVNQKREWEREQQPYVATAFINQIAVIRGIKLQILC